MSTLWGKEMPMDKLKFKAEVKKQLTLRNWSYADLAEHTKYTVGTLRTMLYNGEKLSLGAMQEIAKALDIKLE